MGTTLQEWAGAGPTSMTTLALVFTDIVGSTDLAVKNGDKKWIEILIQHFRQARRIKDACDGYEVKLIGDAYMVAFRTTADAFQFAWQFYNDTGHPQVRIRIAMHVGQVRIVEDDIYGLMVNYTSRVQHLLPGLGIMLSDAAKTDIVAELGKDLPEFSLIPVRKTIKSFGEQNLWFVGKKLTPLQESALGKTFRKVILNESERTKRGHTIVLTSTNILEFAASLTDTGDFLQMRNLLQKVEQLPLRYIKEWTIPHEELRSAKCAYRSIKSS